MILAFCGAQIGGILNLAFEGVGKLEYLPLWMRVFSTIERFAAQPIPAGLLCYWGQIFVAGEARAGRVR
jgi:hypothetical protein